MTESLLLLNTYLANGILLLEIFTFILLLDLLSGKKIIKNLLVDFSGQISSSLQSFVSSFFSSNHSTKFVFVLSFITAGMTLVYSEYFGVVPCALCWFERIFMYGNIVMLVNAIYKKETEFIKDYVMKFSFIGALIALYHHLLQMIADANGHLPCPTSGGDCAKRIIFEYGHITFPWMAFVLFVFIIVYLKYTKE